MATTELTTPYAIEIVNYQLVEGADEDRFLEINRAVGAEFTSAQPGFLRREIGRAEDGTWLIAVYWETPEHARNSIGNIEKIPPSVETYMASIDRATLTRSIFEMA
jgi:hypothetical protein